MTYAKNAQISVSEILTTVKEELYLTDTSQWDFRLNNLIKDCYTICCTADQTIRIIQTLDICDAAATLPANFVMFDTDGGIRFGERPDLSDTNFYVNGNYWLQPVFTGNAFYNDGRYNQESCFSSVQIRGKHLIFNSDITFGQVHISFLGLRINDDNTPFIPANLKQPLVNGTCFKFIRSSKHLTGHGADQMNDYKLGWINGKAWAEGQSRLPDALMRQAINRIWNSYL